jgi:hypothetical protein
VCVGRDGDNWTPVTQPRPMAQPNQQTSPVPPPSKKAAGPPQPAPHALRVRATMRVAAPTCAIWPILDDAHRLVALDPHSSVIAVDSRAEGAWSARISGRVIGARSSATVTTAERAPAHRLVLSSGNARRNAWATTLALAVADCVEWTLEGDSAGTTVLVAHVWTRPSVLLRLSWPITQLQARRSARRQLRRLADAARMRSTP